MRTSTDEVHVSLFGVPSSVALFDSVAGVAAGDAESDAGGLLASEERGRRKVCNLCVLKGDLSHTCMINERLFSTVFGLILEVSDIIE